MCAYVCVCVCVSGGGGGWGTVSALGDKMARCLFVCEGVRCCQATAGRLAEGTFFRGWCRREGFEEVVVGEGGAGVEALGARGEGWAVGVQGCWVVGVGVRGLKVLMVDMLRTHSELSLPCLFRQA